MSALRKHLPAIAAVDQNPSLKYMVAQYFNLQPGPLSVALQRAGLGQADIVLCLMHVNRASARKIVEALMGKPITVAPACLFRYRVNGAQPTLSRQPVITWVKPNVPLRKGTKIGQCFCEFRVGRTRQQLLVRGVSRGDIRRAVKRGWIQMTGAV